jgi:amino acid transporter/mannitol/fructose-specific phosphotransferase system IIA component (Ntr-type)
MKLARRLGLLDVFCIASGAMISSGLFVLPGMAFAKAGPAVVASYVLASLLAITGMLSIAELTTAMPKAGGDCFYITRGMGSGVGTVAGLLNWFALSLKSAFALVGMVAFAGLLFPAHPQITGAILCAVFVAINLIGVKEAAWFQVALVVGLFGLLGVYIVVGFPAINVNRLEPFTPQGLKAVAATAGFVFVSYGGLLKTVSVAEEIRHPGRVIPQALILSLLTVGLLYGLTVFVTVGVVDGGQLKGSLTPITDAASAFLGRGGMVAMSIAAILAFISTANAGIMAASRYLLALSRDGQLPPLVGRVGRRFHTPHFAILLTGVVVLAGIFIDITALVKAASVVLILSYILSNLAVIVLRESHLQNYRPLFRTPLYPWIQLIGIGGFGLLLFEMGEPAFIISAVMILSAFLVYWIYGRRRAAGESALLHLIERITDKKLVTGTLEAELKQIIRERDRIELDRFDGIIENSVVLDVDRPMAAEEFFHLVADKMSKRLGLWPEAIHNLLVEREKESSTVISPGLAIPHVVVPGEGTFDVLLARSRDGITFSKDKPAVHSVFVLLGTKDERNYHLQALSAIAQIVQDKNFEKRWMRARSEQALRDVILLSERKRA